MLQCLSYCASLPLDAPFRAPRYTAAQAPPGRWAPRSDGPQLSRAHGRAGQGHGEPETGPAAPWLGQGLAALRGLKWGPGPGGMRPGRDCKTCWCSQGRALFCRQGKSLHPFLLRFCFVEWSKPSFLLSYQNYKYCIARKLFLPHSPRLNRRSADAAAAVVQNALAKKTLRLRSVIKASIYLYLNTERELRALEKLHRHQHLSSQPFVIPCICLASIFTYPPLSKLPVR